MSPTPPITTTNTGRTPDDSVQFVKGVGPTLAELLAKKQIGTVRDLLMTPPMRYEDRTVFRRIIEAKPGEVVTISGHLLDVQTTKTARKGMHVTRALISDGAAVAQLVFFRQPYLERTFAELVQRQASIVAFGTIKRTHMGGVEMEHPEWEETGSDALSMDRIVPVYGLTEGLTQWRMRRAVDAALTGYEAAFVDPLPPTLRSMYGLRDLNRSLRALHFPLTLEEAKSARRRLVFEEFLALQLILVGRRRRLRHDGALKITMQREQIFKELHSLLPFDLTQGQRTAVNDVHADLMSGLSMNRMIQGDVGSGKTAVAFAAMLMVVRSGAQAALMAPTEVLARQHFDKLGPLLERAGISSRLAVGSLSAANRGRGYESIESGETQVVIGTQALIQEGMLFKNLGLAITDEQHRFGVLQRQALQRKSERPHVLVMTATPIPRTLTMTLFGDLETTLIKDLPPGRKPIKTHWKGRDQAQKVYRQAAGLLQKGRQAFVVCPMIEESEKLQAQAASQLAEKIRRDYLPEYRIGLMHGQLKTAEKDAVMTAFRNHELDVLVSTTVIEVGVDVPNATIMIIEDADRFGLAQLHQLRGRVGRGEHSSFCVLLSDPTNVAARQRLQVLEDTNDGFRIAEEDLRLRGPGEFLGTRQSGLPETRVGNLVTDGPILEEARQAAETILSADPALSLPEHVGLRGLCSKVTVGVELGRVG